MLTFRLHGRKDICEVAKVLARTGFLSGFQVQSFEEFRQNSLSYTRAFVKFDKERILSKSPVTEPDFIIVSSSDNVNNVFKDAKPDTIVIINSKEKLKNAVLEKKKIKPYYADAETISFNAIKNHGSSMALLGALVKVCNKISLKNAKQAIETECKDLRSENNAMMEEGYKSVKK